MRSPSFPDVILAGAVNVNLGNLRQRVDKALGDMHRICANLETATARVAAHQLDLRAFANAVRSGKDAPGVWQRRWSSVSSFPTLRRANRP